MPNETKQLAAEEALARLNALREFAKNHTEEWKNQLADDLNHIMGRAVWWLETDRDEIDADFGAAVVRVVERVAEFEKLQTTESAPVKITTDKTYGLSRKMGKIQRALHDYHHRLDNREHAGVAADRLVKAVEDTLGKPWVQGATLKKGKPNV